MHMEMPLGNDPEFVRSFCDLLSSVLPEVERLDLRADDIGAFDTQIRFDGKRRIES